MTQELKDLHKRVSFNVFCSIAGFVICTSILVLLISTNKTLEKNSKRIEVIELRQAVKEATDNLWKSKIEEQLKSK